MSQKFNLKVSFTSLLNLKLLDGLRTYMIIDVVGVDKPIKIPSGFYLSDEDYETFRWKVPLKEQK